MLLLLWLQWRNPVHCSASRRLVVDFWLVEVFHPGPGRGPRWNRSWSSIPLQRDERRIDAHKFPLSPRCTWHIGHFLLHHQCDDESTLFLCLACQPIPTMQRIWPGVCNLISISLWRLGAHPIGHRWWNRISLSCNYLPKLGAKSPSHAPQNETLGFLPEVAETHQKPVVRGAAWRWSQGLQFA
jgi:hypothetical protein